MLEDILNEANSLAGETIDAIRDATASVKAVAEKDSDVAVVVAMEDYDPFSDGDADPMVCGLVVDGIGRRRARMMLGGLKRHVSMIEKAVGKAKKAMNDGCEPVWLEGVDMLDVFRVMGTCNMVKDTLARIVEG